MADQMEALRALALWTEHGGLGGKLLNPVFAEECKAKGPGFKDGLGGEGFGDGHQFNFCTGAACDAAGVGDAVLKAFEIFAERTHDCGTESASGLFMRLRALSRRPVTGTCSNAWSLQKRGMLTWMAALTVTGRVLRGTFRLLTRPCSRSRRR